MVTNRASLLANLLLYTYDYQYTKSEAKAFNLTFMYIDDIVY